MPSIPSVAALFAATVAAQTADIDLNYVTSNTGNILDLVQRGQARIAEYNQGNSEFNKLLNNGPATNSLVSYVAPVNIGGSVYQLIVDTGSSNTWCGANKTCEPSATGQTTGGTVSVSYGSGSFSGKEYTDKVTYGGLSVNQSVGSASQSTGFTGVDGIIGFGPVGLTAKTVSNANTVPTFMDNLKSAGLIAVEALGVYFAPFNPNTSNGTNGVLTLGGANPNQYTGSLSYFPKLADGSLQSHYWGLKTQSFKYGKTVLSTGTRAIVDTGTTLIYIPQGAFNKFVKASKGTFSQSIGLITYKTAPTGNFILNVGGQSFPLTPSQYLIPQYLYASFGLPSGKYYAWFANGGTGGVNCLVGQKFLENYYSVFDTTNSRIGFATRA